jgi:hypothetical protein
MLAAPVWAQEEGGEEGAPAEKAAKHAKGEAGEEAAKPAKKPKAAEEGEAPAKAKSALRGEYAIMASECGLDDTQKAALEAAVAAKEEAMKAGKEKADALKKDLAAAKEKNDEEAVKRIGGEIKALQTERGAVETEHQGKILGCLSPEQRTTWEGFKLYRGLMYRYSKAELDEGQKAKVRGLANEGAKKMLAVEGAGKEAEEAKDKIEKDLKASVENDVLTAEQKEKLNAPKAPKEKAPKTGAEGAKEGPAGM